MQASVFWTLKYCKPHLSFEASVISSSEPLLISVMLTLFGKKNTVCDQTQLVMFLQNIQKLNAKCIHEVMQPHWLQTNPWFYCYWMVCVAFCRVIKFSGCQLRAKNSQNYSPYVTIWDDSFMSVSISHCLLLEMGCGARFFYVLGWQWSLNEWIQNGSSC